jgi:primosomal protein N' (replication factor Y)
VFLLRGVTGSGKTEVYLQAAERVLARGRGVLFLVPEIALTHELVSLVYSRFGSTVALLHSALSAGERWDEWRRLSRREARMAIGVRSAVFAPVPDLGLVVVDEEHDGAYKQEEGLRYNARDLAVVRARNAGCPVVLGSATPSIESHHNSLAGRYRLLELADRIAERPLPVVELVDLKSERPEGDPAVFAKRLRTALAENLAAGDQSLVFLNRRGYAHYLQCTACGHVMGCPNCSVTLTFHRQRRVVRCHHCDYTLRAPDLCPECSGPSLADFGVGTEQVESALRALFPEARVARMDRDTVSRKGADKGILTAWREKRIDILVGTQMVTKGHDVPGVTFVGVVAADQALNFPDFRAAERTFQLLTQVAGRAGRGDRPGRVMIQTYRPTHYALRFAMSHDFVGFAEREVRYREALAYPPFSRLVNLRLDGPDAARVEAAARELAAGLRAAGSSLPRRSQPVILGPAPAPLERLRGRYRWQILLKGRDARTLQSVVRPACEAVRKRARAASVRIAIDVDPYSML